MNCQTPRFTLQVLKLITVNTQNIGFKTKKVLNLCLLLCVKCMFKWHTFHKFNVTENIKYCLSHFICSLISIYTYSSARNLFMTSKQTEKVKKTEKLSHIGSWIICVMLHINFIEIFRKIYWYLKWVNYKPFIYLLWTTSIIQL